MPKNLTILQLYYLHGYLEPHYEVIREGDHKTYRTLGGLARIATAFRKIRVETINFST